jgi:hypoxanthine phosphoribosyltransferase
MNHPLPEVCDGILLKQEAIESRVRELGESLVRDHTGHDLRLITVLRGGLFFLSDLCRATDMPVSLDFMAVSAYGPAASGSVRITKDLDDSIEGASVVVVEDIIDTGLTLHYVLEVLRRRGPASLEVCTLMDKGVRRIVDLPITYQGFRVPDRFLVGYGLASARCTISAITAARSLWS